MEKPSLPSTITVNSSSNNNVNQAATTSSFQVVSYMLTFFIMMIIHEVALEAASTSFRHLESLASTVTLFQFGFCFLLPLIISRKDVVATFPRTIRATLPYIKLSLLVFGATGLATQSLKYVSYPTKVVFKSAKLIPTMVVSTILHKNAGSKYGPLDYFAALLLCLGAAGYGYNSSSASGDDENKTSIYGITLLTISIICDALVPNLQQKLMSSQKEKEEHKNEHEHEHEHEKDHEQMQMQTSLLPTTTAANNWEEDKNTRISKKDANDGLISSGLSAQAVMVNTNAVGFGTILLYMLLSGSLRDTVTTATSDPTLLLYLSCVGIGLSTAVLAYTKLIKASGSVVAVAVSTMRKVATVLLSYILFPKPLLPIHAFSGLLVLIGVLIATFCRKKKHLTSHSHTRR